MKKNIQSATSKPKTKTGNPQSLRVLIVEDSEDDALLIIRELKKGGYNPVHERVETAAAMKKALKEKQWDIILCNYKLPKFNAAYAIALSKGTNIGIPLIIVSGAISEETAVECLRLGAHDYIMKNNLSRLCPAIARELEETNSRIKQKQAKETILNTEKRFKALYQESPIPTFTWQKKGDDFFLTDCNRAAILLTEGRASNYMGKSAQELYRKRTEIIDDMLRCFKEQSTISRELVSQHFVPGRLLSVYYSYIPLDLIIVHMEDITERKQAEEALRKSEEKYRLVVENAKEAIIITQDVKLVFVNRAAASMTGYSEEILTSKTFTEFIYPDDRNMVVAHHIGRIKGEEVPDVYSFRVLSQDGTIKWVELNAAVIQWKGRPATLNFLNDITERKQAEEALTKSEEKFRKIFYTSPDVVSINRLEDGTYISINPGFTRIMGYTEKDIIGKTSIEYNIWDNIKDRQRLIAGLEKDGEVINLEAAFRTKSGEIRYGLISASVIDLNRVLHILGVVRDITERKRLQETLDKERDDLRLIIDASPIIVFYKDKEGRFIRVNKIFAEALNRREEDFVGKTVFDFYSPQIAQSMTGDDQEVFQSRHPKLNIIEQYESASGIRWVQTDKIPIFDKDGVPVGLIGFAQDITDRKRAEEELRESEENFRLSLNNSPLGIRTVTAEGETIYANRAVLDMYGYASIDELRKTPLKDRYTPESYADFQIRNEKRRQGEFGPSEYEISIVRKNGEIRHLQVFRKEVIWNGAKQFQILYQDITERKRAEEELVKSEEKYRNILESIEEGYYEVDLAGNTTFVNDSTCQIYGYPKEELIGMNNRDYTSKETAKKVFQVFNEVYRTGNSNKGNDYGIIRKDGTKRYITSSVALMKDSSGKAIGFRGITQDITERKQAQEKLRQSEEKYRLTFASTSDIIFTVDPELKVSNITPSVEKVLGYSPQELINKSFSDLHLMTPESLERAIFNVQQVFSGLDVPTTIYEFITKDGVKGIGEVTGSPIIQEGKIIGVTCVARDITERMLAAAALTKSEEKYRSLVENAQEGIYQSAVGYLTLNPALARMLGYDSPEEVMATITDLARQLYVNPDDRKKLLEMVNEKGSITDFETEYYKKDGSRLWVSINMHAVRDGQGRILYYQGINQDITEKKKIEAERQENIERLRKSLGATINAMAVTVETRDPYTAGHQRRVADLARAIAMEMNLKSEQIDGVRMASMIHDIGKISIPSEILTKPTELTKLEFNLIKTHPDSGYNILKDIEFPWPIARIVLEHHERIDGSGYPNGLKGEQTLLESRIIAIADVVEAISSHRPYRAAQGLDVALAEISKNKGILYEPDIVDACLRLFREKNYKLAA